MLSRIFIQNFALIDRLEIGLREGLQVITGETGAGKSIILGALRLIFGGRADLKTAADSETKSVVEAEFNINNDLKPFFEESDLDFEPQTIIRREILPSGKSRAFVNYVPVTLDVLKALSAQLIDIHSQFESSDLFSEEYQFRIVDGLSENKNLLPEYQEEFHRLQKLRKDLGRMKKSLAEGNREADYKQFLLEELEELRLDELDYDELQNRLAFQANAGMITENLAAVIAKFHLEDLGILASLNDSRSRLAKVAEIAPEFAELGSRMEQAFIEFKDIVSEIESHAEKIETDPELLAALDLTNSRINALLLKHSAADISELREIRDRLAAEQGSFADLENNITIAEKEIGALEISLKKLAENLSQNRLTAAQFFKEKTEALLRQLGLEKAQIAVELLPAEDFNQFGNEKIAILFQANSGFPMKPIQTAISGGERSRVMLAVKKIMAENASLPTLILDEIDTGVSGRIAEEMGKVMREMSRDMQLIVITHLAQVAAKGADNYKVLKQDVDGRTRSTIVPLDAEEKLREIAQLLSGSRVTEAAMMQARELMAGA